LIGARIPNALISATDQLARHCQCVYYQDWARARRAKPTEAGKLPPAVSRALIINPLTKSTDTQALSVTSPRSTLTASSGHTIAAFSLPDTPTTARPSSPSPLTLNKRDSLIPAQPAVVTAALSFDEEAKLVFGVVLSLKNMVKKLSGRCAHPPCRHLDWS
jgi:trafficking protein particle complex subunit 1